MTKSSKNSSASLHVLKDMVCTYCACMCDDLEITVDGSEVVELKHACGAQRLTMLDELQRLASKERKLEPRPVSTEQAVGQIAAWLRDARRPLFTGLRYGVCEAQQAMVKLADLCGGLLGERGPHSDAATRAMQQVGQSTCSWGEVANRADLVIFWDIDPARTHPRHLERYSLFPKGEFVPRGREDRYCVVIAESIESNQTAAQADLAISSGRQSPAMMVSALRAIARGVSIDEQELLRSLRVSGEVLADLIQRIKSAKYVVNFFGGRFLHSQQACETLFTFVREMNAYTRVSCSALADSDGNPAGAESVVAWSTGFPIPVDLSSGVPRYVPAAGGAAVLDDYDLVVQLSRDSIRVTKPAAAGVKQRDEQAEIATATFGLSTAGTVIRADEVALPLRPIVASKFPPAEEVLSAIAAKFIALGKAPS